MPAGPGDLHPEGHQLGVEAGRRSGRGVHEHEGGDPLRRRQHEPPHHHPAHRVAEQPQIVEAGGVDDVADVGSEPVEGVGVGVVGIVALAVAAVVERDDAVVAREDVDMVGEVLLGTAEPVHQEQRRAPPPGPRRRSRGPRRRRSSTRTGPIYGRSEQPVNEPVT